VAACTIVKIIATQNEIPAMGIVMENIRHVAASELEVNMEITNTKMASRNIVHEI